MKKDKKIAIEILERLNHEILNKELSTFDSIKSIQLFSPKIKAETHFPLLKISKRFIST